MRYSLRYPLIALLIFLSGRDTFAENKGFASLTDCWSALNGAPVLGARAQMKQDFHLLQVQHRADAGKDSFMVLNREGAQLLTPSSSMEPKATTEGMSSYQMTIVPPGESHKMQASYFTYARNARADTLGWVGPVGSEKAQNARFEKYENDPVKALDFSTARETLRMVFKEKAKSEQAALEKTKERMQFWNKTDYYTTDGRITRYTLEFHRERIDRALSLVGACSEVSDETIKQAGLQQKETLRLQKEFLISLISNPVGASAPTVNPRATRAAH